MEQDMVTDPGARVVMADVGGGADVDVGLYAGKGRLVPVSTMAADR